VPRNLSTCFCQILYSWEKKNFEEDVFIFYYSYIYSESKNITGEILLMVEPGLVCCASYTAFSFIFETENSAVEVP